jgi:hypothetical protein
MCNRVDREPLFRRALSEQPAIRSGAAMPNLRKLSCGAAIFGISGLLSAGCAEGVGLDEEGILATLDAAAAAPAPVVDAGPTYAPLPPELALPTTPTAPVAVARPDAGSTSGTPSTGSGRTTSDAGAARPTQTRDAGTSRPAATGCNAASCKNSCGLDGPINCCTLLDTCGCTWAPGAYCL